MIISANKFNLKEFGLFWLNCTQNQSQITFQFWFQISNKKTTFLLFYSFKTIHITHFFSFINLKFFSLTMKVTSSCLFIELEIKRYN